MSDSGEAASVNKVEGGKVTALANGPYLVTGCIVTDAQGNIIEGETVALCACGASKTFPKCDGSHKTISRAQE